MFIEKRKFRRVEKKFEARYKLMPKDNMTEALKKEGSGLDVSVGGIRIEGDPMGNVGDVIKIEFIFQGLSVPVVTFAEIKWIRQIDGKPQFGVEFLALKESDKEALDKALEA